MTKEALNVASPDKNELGKMLKQRRLALAMTLQELARASQVSAAHLGRIERGERFPSAFVLRKVASPLRIKEVELMYMAGFLTPQTADVESAGNRKLDIYVEMMLSEEPVEIQRAAVAVLVILKNVARGLQLKPDARNKTKRR